MDNHKKTVQDDEETNVVRFIMPKKNESNVVRFNVLRSAKNKFGDKKVNTKTVNWSDGPTDGSTASPTASPTDWMTKPLSDIEIGLIEGETVRYIVNLNDPPEKRWTHIVEKYKNECKKIFTFLDGEIGGTVKWMAVKLAELYAGKVFYIQELYSIAKILEISIGELILMQLCYEMYACCTSVVINCGKNTVHYRTMDWDMPDLCAVTIGVDFVRDGKVVFSGTTWAGYVGMMTAVKPNVCAVSLNYRRTAQNSQIIKDNVMTNVRHSINGSWPVGFLIRHLMETENQYDKIVQYMENSKLIAPCYLTISGAGSGSSGQGVVISRTRESVDKKNILGHNRGSYIVQTNIDYDMTHLDVPNILYSKERIIAVDQLMRRYPDQGFDDIRKLFLFFGKKPIINEETIYVTIMKSNTGEIHSYC
jgi:hypothetical protein